MKLKRYLSFLLALLMCLTFLPAAALAAGTNVAEDEAAEVSAETPYYIQDIDWNRSKKADYPVYMRSDEFPYIQPFEFDPAVTEYDLVFP